MTEPQYPPRLGQTIAREAGIGAGSLDPVASGPDDAPLDYYERTMRGNVAALRKALVTSREPAP
jgi:zinc/manganese transport system substrate-binding protein/zinc transport system substrate-binding protein